jgi:hypothetical protein
VKEGAKMEVKEGVDRMTQASGGGMGGEWEEQKSGRRGRARAPGERRVGGTRAKGGKGVRAQPKLQHGSCEAEAEDTTKRGVEEKKGRRKGQCV